MLRLHWLTKLVSVPCTGVCIRGGKQVLSLGYVLEVDLLEIAAAGP